VQNTDADVEMLSAAMPTPADVGLNLDNEG